MANLKEIRRRIQSVVNTKQITRAMKLVSAAKLRRAQSAAENGRAFREQFSLVVSEILQSLPEGFKHPLMEKRDVKKRQIIAISGERGLCGGYNANVIKAIETTDLTEDINTEFVPIGRRTVASAHRFDWKTLVEYEGLSEDAGEWPIAEIAEQIIKDFVNGDCDEVVIYYTKFVSAMTQEVTREVLLPLDVSSAKSDEANGSHEFDPSASEMFLELAPTLIRNSIQQAGLESKASEHAARMTAMESATNNANDLIGSLTLYYNRARQSAITTELVDIIGGAEATK